MLFFLYKQLKYYMLEKKNNNMYGAPIVACTSQSFIPCLNKIHLSATSSVRNHPLNEMYFLSIMASPFLENPGDEEGPPKTSGDYFETPTR